MVFRVNCSCLLQPEWKLADPICTFIFSVLVLFTTFTILREIFAVLMEGKLLHTSVFAAIASCYKIFVMYVGK